MTMAKEPEKTFDIVVFGATGFTGQFVVEEIARTEAEIGKLKWAIAGRSATKLQNVLIQASNSTGRSLEGIPIIIADVSSDTSMQEMCKQAKVVLNCVGPYQFYGEPVVKACIANKANHVDISGEVVFLEGMQLKYDKAAKEAGVYIMEACGFDSIPADMGMVHIRDNFKGDLNHIELFMKINIGSEGLRLNFGTFQSGIHGYNISRLRELAGIRKELRLQPMPHSNQRMPRRWPLFHSKDVDGWCFPLTSADPPIIERSTRHFYEHDNKRPVLFRGFMCVPNLITLFFLTLLGLSMGIFSNFSWGVKLLETFPGLMTFGLFTKKGPTKKQIAGTSFTMRLEGHGHSTKLQDVNEKHQDKPTHKIVTKITGPELAYVTTPICMVQAAYVMLKETDKLPQGGGVFTPGAAFAKTSLIERLNHHNVKFEIVSH